MLGLGVFVLFFYCNPGKCAKTTDADEQNEPSEA